MKGKIENMKIRIIDLLNKISNNEQPPMKIVFKNKVYVWYESDGDYISDDEYDAIFDYHEITDILNDEVEILETTITYNQDNKIRKLDENSNIFNKGFIDKFTENELILIDKINEIIDKVNNL